MTVSQPPKNSDAMLDLILYSPIILLAFAIVFARLIYLRTKSIIWSSTVFTVFFSFGIANGRLPLPLPTLILIPLMISSAINAPPCVRDGDGCDQSDSEFLLIYCLLIPLAFQWAFWTISFATTRFLFFTDDQL